MFDQLGSASTAYAAPLAAARPRSRG